MISASAVSKLVQFVTFTRVLGHLIDVFLYNYKAETL